MEGSFIDLATMAHHRRNEMEARINVFLGKCDQAIVEITKLKIQAKSLIGQLNCEPSVLKERFLNGMKTLDEFIYLITDFNLAVGKLEEMMPPTTDFAPVQDSTRAILQPIPAFNIMDMLSEPTRQQATSTACSNYCPIPHRKKKIHRDEQSLIFFSSTSCSSESVPIAKSEVGKKEMTDLSEEVKKISVKAESIQSSPSISTTVTEPCNLPAQTLLQVEQIYPATLMNVDGSSLWIITDDVNATCRLMTDMTEFYKEHYKETPGEDLANMTYCAYYDEEGDCYYRALVIPPAEGEAGVSELVFLVDTGEVRPAHAQCVRPLLPRFAALPPAARCAHLAGIELITHDKDLMDEQEKFLQQYIGTHCSIEVDDNSSESLGVYVLLSETETLNDLMVQKGLAYAIGKPPDSSSPPALTHGPPELATSCALDSISNCEEYEDPLLAVTGYHCRDEADICKHYKGPPEKTCFKGANCTKRHVLKHPDGWTLDRTGVVARCRALPLPAPGSWLRALVVYIGHYNRLCVQLLRDSDAEKPLPRPEFGTVLPPRSLDELVLDMNSPASRIAYKPLKMIPAPGELVAALYPLDDRWYRARVVTYTRADQNVEVMYIDYGNLVWVREDSIRELDTRFAVLPAQAINCVLAGVSPKSDDSRSWSTAKQQLTHLVLDRPVELHVIARGYDEITVEMFDAEGHSVAERLAALGVVKLQEYVTEAEEAPQKLVSP